MKYFFALILSLFSLQPFAQQQPQQVMDPKTQKQVQLTQQKAPVPQVSVFRYDTVITHDPQYPNKAELEIYSSSGRLVKSGKILNGKKEGIWRSYYENGMISRVEEYHEDVLNGLTLAIEATGTVSEEDNIVNGLKTGVSHQYNRNGTIKLEENYSNGVLNGMRRMFGQDGKMQEEGYWKNGKRDSINRWAYPSGKIYVEYTYKNGNISGPARLFYENGNVKASGNYSEGYEEGAWKEYADSTKKVSAEGSYKAGKKVGVWKTYKADGTPDKTQEYDANGTLLKETAIMNSKQKTK
jgi:antitoxin component YwqK of YwqJK toxin-antitoxin module